MRVEAKAVLGEATVELIVQKKNIESFSQEVDLGQWAAALGAKFINFQHTLESFYSKFCLPAASVKSQDVFGAEQNLL